MDSIDRRNATVKRLRNPKTADNLEVRKRLLKRVKEGEITLDEAKAELSYLQAKARKQGFATSYHS